MYIKVCGLKYEENIQAIADLKPDYLGFIFYKKSPRYVANELSPIQLSNLDVNLKKAGVFVNEDLETIKQICSVFNIETIQLHGSESPAFCKQLKDLGFTIIKAFGMHEDFDFEEVNPYTPICDFFLFDTKSSVHGGSGNHFHWELLKKYHLSTPYFLSGGISLNDLEEIKKIKDDKLYAIDVNSRFELKPGFKDIQAIKSLIKKIRDEF